MMHERTGGDSEAYVDICHPSYQIAAFELLFKSLSLANPSGVLEQPSPAEGRSSIELVAGDSPIDTLAPLPDSVYISIYPTEGTPKENQLLASIQLCDNQSNNPKLDNAPAMDIVAEYTLAASGDSYCAQKRHLLFRYNSFELGLDAYAPLDEETVVSSEEIEALTKLISAYQPAPVNFDS